MGRTELTERLGAVFRSWVTDPGSDVVATELVDGRWAVRMAQQTRDFTTVWVEPGDRTVGFEAYVLPAPRRQLEEVYRLLLVRNHRAWRVHFAIDHGGGIYLRGRTEAERADEEVLQYVFAEIYEMVDLTFRLLVRTGFGR
ncbi:MAG: YbjN domain-containing protein [bacterium]|nr:YbjN domain-containing protein [bacterium]